MAPDPADAASTAWIPALCSPLRSTLQFAERDLWNIASVRLDTGELHHLGPLFGFLCDQLAELRGDPGSATPPRSARRAFILGSARAALTSLLSLSTISAGVFAGTPRPYH